MAGGHVERADPRGAGQLVLALEATGRGGQSGSIRRDGPAALATVEIEVEVAQAKLPFARRNRRLGWRILEWQRDSTALHGEIETGGNLELGDQRSPLGQSAHEDAGVFGTEEQSP